MTKTVRGLCVLNRQTCEGHDWISKQFKRMVVLFSLDCHQLEFIIWFHSFFSGGACIRNGNKNTYIYAADIVGLLITS